MGDQVEYHLKLVIHLWCGAVPSQYSPDSQLRDIWQSQVANLDYDTYGVPRLRMQIFRDALFGSCQAAHDQTTGEFLTGGGIQTVGTLYLQLLPCAQSAAIAQVNMPFASSSVTTATVPRSATKKSAKKTAKKTTKARP
jgi:hypothetical protein